MVDVMRTGVMAERRTPVAWVLRRWRRRERSVRRGGGDLETRLGTGLEAVTAAILIEHGIDLGSMAV
ncbi:hypothetical protein M0R45_027800 [Rubus argutus]|uniref:Uncharacterized protein n=1 Tax=Rubus argutus TaxID=59490 RepID=A0AAW1X1L6_RUBAR